MRGLEVVSQQLDPVHASDRRRGIVRQDHHGPGALFSTRHRRQAHRPELRVVGGARASADPSRSAPRGDRSRDQQPGSDGGSCTRRFARRRGRHQRGNRAQPESRQSGGDSEREGRDGAHPAGIGPCRAKRGRPECAVDGATDPGARSDLRFRSRERCAGDGPGGPMARGTRFTWGA